MSEATSNVVRVDIPPRYLYVTGTGIVVGMGMGMMRGGRQAGLRFLAENVHRAPRTVGGWYFYNKTKNYKVMLGALKGGGVESMRLGLAGAGWVGMEELGEQAGWGPIKQTCAGAGTGAGFGAVCEYGACWGTSAG